MRKSLTLFLFLAASLSASLLPGCIVAAAAGAGIVAGEVLLEDNTYIGHINIDSGRAWAQVKATLSQRSQKPIDVEEARRKVVADIDGATVSASVETYDLNVSVLRVSAKKYAFADNEMAKMMFDRITEDLNRDQ